MMFFDGNWKTMERAYGMGERVQVLGSLDGSLGEQLGDAVCLGNFSGSLSGKERPSLTSFWARAARLRKARVTSSQEYSFSRIALSNSGASRVVISSSFAVKTSLAILVTFLGRVPGKFSRGGSTLAREESRISRACDINFVVSISSIE